MNTDPAGHLRKYPIDTSEMFIWNDNYRSNDKAIEPLYYKLYTGALFSYYHGLNLEEVLKKFNS